MLASCRRSTTPEGTAPGAAPTQPARAAEPAERCTLPATARTDLRHKLFDAFEPSGTTTVVSQDAHTLRARTGGRPHITLRNGNIEGPLRPTDAIASRARFTQLVPCYEESVRQRSDLAGQTQLAFSVTPEGTVDPASIRFTEDTLAHPPLEQCLRARLLCTRFPIESAPTAVTLGLEFRLR